MNEIKHTPIMVQEIINNMPAICSCYVDGTTGHGGHMKAIIASGKMTP
jgi:16S rRNA C1402 N4-methylase RsmH